MHEAASAEEERVKEQSRGKTLTYEPSPVFVDVEGVDRRKLSACGAPDEVRSRLVAGNLIPRSKRIVKCVAHDFVRVLRADTNPFEGSAKQRTWGVTSAWGSERGATETTGGHLQDRRHKMHHSRVAFARRNIRSPSKLVCFGAAEENPENLVVCTQPLRGWATETGCELEGATDEGAHLPLNWATLLNRFWGMKICQHRIDICQHRCMSTHKLVSSSWKGRDEEELLSAWARCDSYQRTAISRLYHGALGVIHGALGAIHGALGVIHGALGVIHGALGVIYGALGVNYGALGAIHGALGVIHGALGAIHGALGAIHGALGVIHGALGAVHGALGVIHGALGVIHGAL
eukprot:1175350-Prorocentrum_minimum.AAC.1